MPDELVGKAQPAVYDPPPTDQNDVGKRGTKSETPLPEIASIFQEAEGPCPCELTTELAVLQIYTVGLPPQRRMLVIDNAGKLETRVREHAYALLAIPNLYRAGHP